MKGCPRKLGHCFRCGKPRHIRSSCPLKQATPPAAPPQIGTATDGAPRQGPFTDQAETSSEEDAPAALRTFQPLKRATASTEPCRREMIAALALQRTPLPDPKEDDPEEEDPKEDDPEEEDPKEDDPEEEEDPSEDDSTRADRERHWSRASYRSHPGPRCFGRGPYNFGAEDAQSRVE